MRRVSTRKSQKPKRSEGKTLNSIARTLLTRKGRTKQKTKPRVTPRGKLGTPSEQTNYRGKKG